MYSLLFLESISIECNYFFNYFSNLESILFVQNISLLLLIVSYRINSTHSYSLNVSIYLQVKVYPLYIYQFI